MDRKLELLQAYYGSLPADRVKVETRRHGFAFVAELERAGASLEYGELTLTGLLHKYKLSGVTASLMETLLTWHLRGECNVCRYFGDEGNRLFCFNLDNNHKENNTAPIPEVTRGVQALQGFLEAHGCPPLVLASGRGYHLWCRLEASVPNERLHTFMIRMAAKTAARLQAEGLDHARLKMNLYPDRRARDVVSLRLFGSRHMKTGAFSRVLTQGVLLDEEPSWERFERHLREPACPLAAFGDAMILLDREFGSEGSAP